MALKLGELVAYLKTDNKQLREGMADGRREVRRGGKDMEQEATATAVALATILGIGGQRAGEEFVRGADGRLRDANGRFLKAGEQAAEEFVRGADGRLRDSHGRFVSAGQALGSAAGGAAGGGLSSLRSGLDNLGTGVVNVATNLWNLIPVLAAIGAGAAITVPAVYLLGGALGSLPALITGLAAGAGVLGLGFMGLGDAFKETSSAGGSVVDTAHQVAMAERRVRDANREVLASQEALTRARKEAAERIGDLGRSLAGAKLDEEEAVLAVADAERRLQEAQASGRWDDYLKADLALRQARQTLVDVRDRVGDLAEEHKTATREGVEGSDQVQDALERQERALEAVTDAQYALRQAQQPPAGGGAVAEMTKLAPAAQRVVDVIKSLKPAWESLRLDVQQRLFKGVGTEILLLSSAWLPTLRTRLGGMADTFNGIVRLFSRNIRQPEFIKNIAAGMESVQKLIDRVGRSIAGPFVDAWGRLTRASGPFVEQLGDEIGDVVDDFSRWIKTADESGKLESFFEKASDFLSDVFDMGRDVVSIIGSVISILFQSPDSVTESQWTSAREGLDDLAEWFKDPENQKMVASWFQKIEDAVAWMVEEGIPAVQGWVERVDGWITRAEAWGDKIVAFKNGIVSAFNSVVKFFGDLPNRIDRVTAGMWDGIKNAFRSAVNWVISRWNGLELQLPTASFLGQSIGGGSIGTPNIPHLDVGGDVLQDGVAVIHRGERVMPAAQVSRLDSGHAEPTLIRVVLQYPDGRVIKDQLVDAASMRGQPVGGYLGIPTS